MVPSEWPWAWLGALALLCGCMRHVCAAPAHAHDVGWAHIGASVHTCFCLHTHHNHTCTRRESIGAPGMVVLQFAWGGGPGNVHLPHMHYVNSYVYPGTHDNETCTGWYKDRCTPMHCTSPVHQWLLLCGRCCSCRCCSCPSHFVNPWFAAQPTPHFLGVPRSAASAAAAALAPHTSSTLGTPLTPHPSFSPLTPRQPLHLWHAAHPPHTHLLAPQSCLTLQPSARRSPPTPPPGCPLQCHARGQGSHQGIPGGGWL